MSNHGNGPGCSPACPAWMFVPAAAIRDVLADLAKHVRFAHDRVQMFGNNDTRYDIYRALDPILQPYFAGSRSRGLRRVAAGNLPERGQALHFTPADLLLVGRMRCLVLSHH